ncbi:hypothetical protein WKI68_28500 [Streptomyces sp. MS1.HAVA.3]|uniref:Uncharacterized protein n=1 Tax=Streptomyces caledonius TaxID=3134107 RepID=A0ABU8U9J6_9ACTN
MDSGNRNGLPIEAYALNVTVTSTTGAGHLSVAPDPNSMDAYRNGRPVTPPRPTSSTLNWTAGKDVSNLVQAKPGPHGSSTSGTRAAVRSTTSSTGSASTTPTDL